MRRGAMRRVNFTQCIDLARAERIVCARRKDCRLNQPLRHGQLARRLRPIGEQLPGVPDPIERALQDFVNGFVRDIVHTKLTAVIVDLTVRAGEHQIANAVLGQKVVRETEFDFADVAQVLHVLVG